MGGEKYPPTPYRVAVTQPQHGGEKSPPPCLLPIKSKTSILNCAPSVTNPFSLYAVVQSSQALYFHRRLESKCLSGEFKMGIMYCFHHFLQIDKDFLAVVEPLGFHTLPQQGVTTLDTYVKTKYFGFLAKN